MLKTILQSLPRTAKHLSRSSTGRTSNIDTARSGNIKYIDGMIDGKSVIMKMTS